MILNWFRETRKKKAKARADAAHAQFKASFNEEYAKTDSLLHQTVLTTANGMVRGMMMRWLDDRGERRCRLCLSTEQLHRRIIASKNVDSGRGRKIKQEKVIYLCVDHKDVAMPGLVDPPGTTGPLTGFQSIEDKIVPLTVDRDFLQKQAKQSNAHATSKLEPKAMLDILDGYDKTKDKPLYELHPPMPRRDGGTSTVDVVEESPGVFRMIPPAPHVGPKVAGADASVQTPGGTTDAK